MLYLSFQYSWIHLHVLSSWIRPAIPTIWYTLLVYLHIKAQSDCIHAVPSLRLRRIRQWRWGKRFPSSASLSFTHTTMFSRSSGASGHSLTKVPRGQPRWFERAESVLPGHPSVGASPLSGGYSRRLHPAKRNPSDRKFRRARE